MKIECVRNISQRLAPDYRVESSKVEDEYEDMEEGEGQGLMFSPEHSSGRDWMDGGEGLDGWRRE